MNAIVMISRSHVGDVRNAAVQRECAEAEEGQPLQPAVAEADLAPRVVTQRNSQPPAATAGARWRRRVRSQDGNAGGGNEEQAEQ